MWHCCYQSGKGVLGGLWFSVRRGHQDIHEPPALFQYTVDGNTVIHAPILVRHFSWSASSAGAAAMVFSRKSYALCACQSQIFMHILLEIRDWSPVLYYFLPLRPETSCPVTIQDAINLSQADRVVLGIASPECLTFRWLIPCAGTLKVLP